MVVHSFFSKDEATSFNADMKDNNNFESFEYKVKLLENTVANWEVELIN